MAFNGRPPTPHQQAEARAAKGGQQDEQFFREKRQREAANIARSLELRALRRTKEAAARTAPPEPPKKAAVKKPKQKTT